MSDSSLPTLTERQHDPLCPMDGLPDATLAAVLFKSGELLTCQCSTIRRVADREREAALKDAAEVVESLDAHHANECSHMKPYVASEGPRVCDCGLSEAAAAIRELLQGEGN